MYTSLALEGAAQFLWGIPLSTIAMAWSFWGSRLGFWNWRWSVPLVGVASFGTYCALVSCIQHHLRVHDERTPEELEREEPYASMSQKYLANWFNCNLVYVLKSHFCLEDLPDGAQPQAPFFFGK